MTSDNTSNVLRWDLLEEQLPAGEQLTVRTAILDRQPIVLIALDAGRRRHLLVELSNSEAGKLAERTSRGIIVQTVELKAGKDGDKRFIQITCLDPQGHAALDTIAIDLIEALEAGASIGTIRIVQNVLTKWRRFWSGVSQGVLSKEQQLGLFGELWFLGRWLVPNIGAETAMKMWRGPSGARNDFERPGIAIEVKTTGRVDGVHVIHGLDQLLEPPNGKLMLFSLIVRDEASGTECLPDLVDQIRTLFDNDYNLQSQFDAMLYAAGYDDRLVSEYEKLILRIREEALYNVCEGFPRLVSSSLIAGLPSGIGCVEYELRLDTASAWLLSRTPQAAGAQLTKI